MLLSHLFNLPELVLWIEIPLLLWGLEGVIEEASVFLLSYYLSPTSPPPSPVPVLLAKNQLNISKFVRIFLGRILEVPIHLQNVRPQNVRERNVPRRKVRDTKSGDERSGILNVRWRHGVTKHLTGIFWYQTFKIFLKFLTFFFFILNFLIFQKYPRLLDWASVQELNPNNSPDLPQHCEGKWWPCHVLVKLRRRYTVILLPSFSPFFIFHCCRSIFHEEFRAFCQDFLIERVVAKNSLLS